ncbi:hypothetical protein PVK06_043582 [Gossypium arboreum]|uniref:Uncharacterized protein n=1 Tax=Gossypium arboreum TaxID=29729 RepID=A0ABR0MNV8_GOSAR|nr:hypothetical protein PVK06_043582 [Gossypium arboreum]
MELFDELVEKDKIVEKTLAKLPRSMVTELGKRTSDGASRRLPKRGCDNQSSDKSVRHEFRPSQFKQQSSVVVSTRGSTGGSRWLFCTHCECRHPCECHKLIGECFKCNSKEHLLRDYPNRVKVSRDQSSTPTYVR